MSKELIERLREQAACVYSVFKLHDEAVRLIEAQQKRIDGISVQIGRQAMTIGEYMDAERETKYRLDSAEKLVERLVEALEDYYGFYPTGCGKEALAAAKQWKEQ